MLEVLYSDPRLVAVAKPSGLLVHRTCEADDRETCMTLLRNRLRRWVYPVHRLDRGASGALLFALDPEMARLVTDLFTARLIKKSYVAVVRGDLPDEGDVDSPLIEEPGKAPAEARTLYRRLARVELAVPIGRYPTARYSLGLITPLTGRMHQIRRHMAHIRHPLVGDVNHGEGRHNRLFRERFGVSRLLLHATSLCLPHPETGEELTIKARVPDELGPLFEALSFRDAINTLELG